MPSVPSLDDTKDTAGNNFAPGIVGGLGYGLGSAFLGPALGRPLGGVISGAAVGGEKGSQIAMFGIAHGIESMLSGSSGAQQATAQNERVM